MARLSQLIALGVLALHALSVPHALADDAPCATAMTPRTAPLMLTNEDLEAAHFGHGLGLGGFNIVIDAGTTLMTNAPALAAFERAAAQWESFISDPVTVTIEADLANLGSSSIIGQASSTELSGSYNLIRNAMVADADADDGISVSLPTAAQFAASVPAGFSFTGEIAAPKATLKALGFTGLDGMFGVTDAIITFNSTFSFDFDNSDGVSPGTVDFETVAAHEIGHALGFVSAVDTIDGVAPHAIALEPLDLHRFADGSANDPGTAAEFTTFARNLVPGANGIFDDVVLEGRLSTGVSNGDGRQASHWKDDSLTATLIGVMDPTLPSATVEAITAADLRVLDLMGWDIVAGAPGSTTTTITTTTTTSSSTAASPTSTTTTTAAASTSTTTTLPPPCVEQPLSGFEALECRLDTVAETVADLTDTSLGGAKAARKIRSSLEKAKTFAGKAQAGSNLGGNLRRAGKQIAACRKGVQRAQRRTTLGADVAGRLLPLLGEAAQLVGTLRQAA